MVHLTLLALMLGQTPSITITAPTADSDVVVNTTFHIQWETVIVGDVKIEVTTDDGSSWTTITDTVDDTQADWANFPWQPPDEVSSDCRIRISDYLSGSPSTESATFAIRRPALGDNGDDEGGCAAAPGSAVGVLLALWWRRRRR